jgi:hypothetical protein
MSGMRIDHIFISSRNSGIEANQLLNSGFLEGSNRIHPGQGTRNRKFYFQNFFLEILWENDPMELESELIKKTGLRERVKFWESGFSRFGLGLENNEKSDVLFGSCEYYQPVYFPVGNRFEILPNRENSGLPWTFRGPFRGAKSNHTEPIEHSNGIGSLTQAIFLIPEAMMNSDFVRKMQGLPQVGFEPAEKPGLVLEFDGRAQGRDLSFSELDLTIRF